MIIVTETRYLDGTGDVPKDVEYAKASDYTVQTGDNKGDLVVFLTKGTDADPVYETMAYYRNGSYSKVTLK